MSETHRLKNVVVFIQTILSFVLWRKLITKQNYCIKKRLKKLLLPKKSTIAKLMFLFTIGLSRLISKLKRLDIIGTWKMVVNWALLWWFSFVKWQRWNPNMFSRLNFWVSIGLTVVGRISSTTLIFRYSSRNQIEM